MKEIIKLIKQKKIGDFLLDESLKNQTTYKVGGKASIIVFPKNVEKLIELLKLIKNNNLKYKVLGKGSNVIFSDQDYRGVIIKLDKFNNIEINNNYVTAGAGLPLIPLAYKTSKMGLSGLEFATGIPGTLGGAIYMNAGAYKSDMGYITESVKVLTPEYEVKEIFNKDLNFHYRDSFFQHNSGYICLEVRMVLKKGDSKEILNVIEDRKQRRLMSQPLEYPSAGSVFRNPENDFAGRLIEESGFKGYRKGGAEVSEKHANFIVNRDHATAEDVYELITEIKDKVKKNYQIDLKVEQEFVNWE